MWQSTCAWARRAALAFAVVCVVVCVARLTPAEADAWSVGTLAGPSAGASTPGQPLTLPFPRLGMWGPSVTKQPLADIARYDWVVLWHGASAYIPQLKSLNPHLIALTATNSCEVGYDPRDNAAPDNSALRSVPAQWLLTQVGARLTQGVSSTDASVRVNRVTLSSAGTTYRLFVPGDSVVIDGELAYVEAVDDANSTLTLRRGCVKPAAPHVTGTRVAATITKWPGSLMVDASTFCPAITVDAAVGPETWAEYKARTAAESISDSAWDGILLDTCDPNKSWLVGHSTARTIDPDRSNTLLSDYSVFDAAWNDGINLYERRARALVGDDRIVIVNGGATSFDALNGTIFEGFPDQLGTARGTPWDTVVCGHTKVGSYFDWMAGPRQPNLTTIETYQDNGSPGSKGNGTYDNPAAHPGFVPNYRKMRFGLCTALLNDGFFSYEINTNGHGSLGLLWFDEYDNGGRGRGYLGQPLGPAQRTVNELATPDLVLGGGFDTPADLKQWALVLYDGYAATVALDTADKMVGAASARVDITATAGSDFRISLLRRPVAVSRGVSYTLSFWAKADRPRPIRVRVQNNGQPWNTRLDFGENALTTSWQHFEVAAAAEGSDPAAGVFVKLGQASGSVWLDDLRLQRGSRDVWRRDFEGGVALVNASTSSATVPLGGVLRKIKGTQVPSLNDGSLVARVTLPAKDGLILLRPTASPQGIATQAADQLVAEWRRCASLSTSARDHYARLVRRSAGTSRLRAARARLAWQRALTAARSVREQATACQAALADGDAVSARDAADAARVSAARARTLIVRAWRLGHANASRASAARRSATAGCERLFTTRVCLAELP